ncbi:MAG: NAD(P)/FAD-dependent oxidoreductase, partial [Nitrospiria bacterium]
MIRLTEIKLPLDHLEEDLKAAILKKLKIAADGLIEYTVFKRSVDARKKNRITLIYTLDVKAHAEEAILGSFKRDPHIQRTPDMTYHFVTKAPATLSSRPIVIGAGPCGLFAALVLAETGFRPIVLERGKSVRARTVDTFGFWRKRNLNPESNVQFGEGGAGTFSDGKLYSQIKDPAYRARKVLMALVKAGAPPEILYVSKPHIGTLKLVGIVEKLRANITALGGEIRFQSRVETLDIDGGAVQGVTLEGGEKIQSRHVILAIGHSARDTFQMLLKRGVFIESKPFSIGLRIEHPQSLIDRCRFGEYAGHPLLGAADYKLVHHCKNGRSVYSFCMCPGGTVVAAASETGGVVTNGMSQYSRHERNANSGIVVGVTPADYPEGPLAGIDFQRRWERRAFELGGKTYDAPGQRVGDFLKNQPTKAFGAVRPSYTPGVYPADLSQSLPDFAVEAIREALPVFDQKIKGFAMDDA